ncbi:MFS transporter, putative metabolite transport protein [Ferrimonas sediminum]|uniref:MFS transporter, putative metabolite transport protein n=1 Tax=Ferrimonas sediminum TaxID=718193 RepID=A0A1G8PRY7_9GAMM|nr:MFS transporter [Ferrimonas sediminum]SDI95108.1 MFS transporter, putative metabolite transport protein [Ferrimonas sediminum]
MKNAKSFDDMEFTPLHRKIMLWGSGGPFLDGYILVIIGIALEQLIPQMQLDSNWIGLVGASTLVGLFVGTALFGYIADLFGRKLMFLIDIIAIGALSIATIFVSSPMELVIMRFLIGVVIGADYPIATSMVAEFSPTKHRAFTMGFIALMWYVGATCANAVGYMLYDLEDGWRWMLGSGVIPCLVILLGRFHLPESPRWLMQKGRIEECKQVMATYFGKEIALDVEEKKPTRYRDIFEKRNLRMVIFTGTIWSCQIIPMFAIYTFGPQIIGLLGLHDGKDAALGNILISVFFIAGCVPAMYWLNSIGRRPLLIGSFAIMTAALAVLGIVPNPGIGLVIAAFGLYAFFSGGPGILQWLYPNELFPTEIRASAVGAVMAFSRIGTILSTYALPLFMAKYGVSMTMLMGAVVSLVGFFISVTMAPETRGLALTETSSAKFG